MSVLSVVLLLLLLESEEEAGIEELKSKNVMLKMD